MTPHSLVFRVSNMKINLSRDIGEHYTVTCFTRQPCNRKTRWEFIAVRKDDENSCEINDYKSDKLIVVGNKAKAYQVLLTIDEEQVKESFEYLDNKMQMYDNTTNLIEVLKNKGIEPIRVSDTEVVLSHVQMWDIIKFRD